MKKKDLIVRRPGSRLPWCWRIEQVLFLLALTIIPSMARATTWYVATTGNDSNSGTQTAPFATIQKGVNLAKPGDTVLVANGTYGPNGHYTCGDICSQNGYAAPVTFSSSGTASAPITVAAQNKWGAILDCQLPYGYTGDGTDGVQACDTYFNFQGSASYIVISGFDIQRDYWVGAMVNASNSHITFRQNHFHNIGNRVYSVPSGTSSYGIVGVYAGTGSSYITWDQNEFNNIGRLPHSSYVSDDYSHDHGLYIYNGPYTITNNIFYNQAAGWNIQTSPGSHDISILENTLIGGANPQKDGCLILWGQNTNVTIQNNIFYNGTNYAMDNYQTTQSGSLFDHNVVYGSPSGIVGSIGGSLTETNNLMNVNPLLTAPATNDYHLQSGSPAIDAGAAVSVTEDFDGNPRPLGAAFDIGAYEYAGGTTATAPAAPSGLTATAGSGGVIVLSWVNNATNATATLIERSPNGANFAQVASTTGTTTSWSDSGLSSGTTYYYRVRAQNSAGTSAYSNTANATTPVGGPAAPSSLAATTVSGSSIGLSWINNSTNASAVLIERSTNNTTFSQVASASGTATAWSDSGLAAGTTYYYRVRAQNSTGTSGYSGTASATTSSSSTSGSGQVPAAPTNVAAGQSSVNPRTQINVYWKAAGKNQTGFIVYRSTDKVSWAQVATVGRNATQYDNSGLTPNTRYFYYVVAYDSYGDSAPSNIDSTITAP